MQFSSKKAFDPLNLYRCFYVQVYFKLSAWVVFRGSHQNLLTVLYKLLLGSAIWHVNVTDLYEKCQKVVKAAQSFNLVEM